MKCAPVAPCRSARRVTFRPRRAALSLALLPLAGCAYVDGRLADLHDCFLYRWHDGVLGLSVTAKAGPVEGTLGGWYSEQGWGKDTWWQRPGNVLTNHGTGVPFTTFGPLAYGQSWSRLFATGASGNHPEDPDSFDDVRSWLFTSDVFDLDDSLPFALSPARRVSDLFGVEVGVAPVFWNVHLGFNTAEFADLLLGFVLLDIFGDDGQPRPPTLPYVPAARNER